jgi:hypothetical protein
VQLDGLAVALADGTSRVALESSGKFDLRLRAAPTAVRLAPPEVFASALAAVASGARWFAPLDLGTYDGGADTDLGDVHVDAGFELSGTVTDDRGKAVAGARAVIVLSGALLYSVTAADDGTFRLPGVRTDGYALLFGEVDRGDGWAPRSAELRDPTPSNEPLTVVLRGGHAVVVRCVDDATDALVAPTSVRTVRVEGVSLDNSGAPFAFGAQLRDVAALRVRVDETGMYDVTVTVEGYDTVTEFGVVVSDNNDAEFDARLVAKR